MRSSTAKLKEYSSRFQSKKEISDPALKEEVILKYAPLIKYVAARIAMHLPSNISVEDLISAGIVGLINAIDRYDPSRNTEFKTYAEYRIKGAILDELRSMDWMPRSMRKKAHVIEDTYAKLEKQLGRPADDEEAANSLGITLDEFYKLLDESRGICLLTAMEDMDVYHFYADKATEIDLSEVRDILASAIQALPERERLVVSLYYYDELTMKEIGHILGCSESRISQIHTKAILRLRAKAKRLFPWER